MALMIGRASNRPPQFRWLAGAAVGASARLTGKSLGRRATVQAVLRAALGVVALFVVTSLETYEPQHIALVVLLGAAWLLTSSVVHLAALRLGGWLRSVRRAPTIPLRFTGSMGRFVLRRLERGARVEVHAGMEVVAEVVAGESGDEVLVYDIAGVAESELPELGSAIGQAIEITVAATNASSRNLPFE